jgi:hypothetical protein
LTFSRQIGGAAMEVMWAVAGRSRDIVLEANFRRYSGYERKRLAGLNASIVEVFCECLREEAARRFARRAKVGVHPAHPLTELSASLMDECDGPVGIGYVIRVNTMEPVDLPSVANAVRVAFLSSELNGRRCLIDSRTGHLTAKWSRYFLCSRVAVARGSIGAFSPE